MADDRPSRRRAIFEAAADLPAAERDAFVRGACAGDDALRAEVEALLRSDEASHDDFLRSPVRRAAHADGMPEAIGRYRITGRIGAGGMGVVYEGEQQHPQRRVAIKLVRPEMISARMLSRFRNEAEILGRLEHPGIARIYEAGTVPADGPDGIDRPFFAMELVRGTPLLEFAKDLATPERLRLFADICDAVQHAHQKGVIHRDLKPANILVTADGRAKVLDFGVARATDGDIQAVTVQTDVGQLLGTVPYMSPEQVSGDLGRLDTRSDVYSLGVVLFELLTGALPHDVRERSVLEAARIVRDEESTRLSAVMPALRGDLEWIVAKALEKDVERRYDSASALGADVRRHLADEPVLAGPPSASYRLRKFVRRNKVGVAWAAAAAILLVLGLVVATGLTIRANHAERLAQSSIRSWRRELDRSRIGADFLVWALAKAPPEQAAAIRGALDTARTTIGDRFGATPTIEADVRRLVGDVYLQIGAYDAAYAQLLAAYELMSAMPDESAFEQYGLVQVLNGLNLCERELGRGEAVAFAWYSKCLDVLERAAARTDPELAARLRDMRADLIVAGPVPPRAVQDEHLARVLAAYARTPDPESTGRVVAAYVLYMCTYVGNVFYDFHVAFPRAATEILDAFETPRVERELGMALWMEARLPAPKGDEERRVRIARRLVEGQFGYGGWWPLDFDGVLGDALVQRGRDEDQDEIARRLATSNRGLRELSSRDAASHALLEYRRAISLHRLVAFEHDDRVVHLADRPGVLDELEAGIEAMSMANALASLAGSMASRTDRSDTWQRLAARAAERALALARGEFPDSPVGP